MSALTPFVPGSIAKLMTWGSGSAEPNPEAVARMKTLASASAAATGGANPTLVGTPGSYAVNPNTVPPNWAPQSTLTSTAPAAPPVTGIPRTAPQIPSTIAPPGPAPVPAPPPTVPTPPPSAVAPALPPQPSPVAINPAVPAPIPLNAAGRPDATKMVAGQKYATARGPATWDGKVFTADTPAATPPAPTPQSTGSDWAANQAAVAKGRAVQAEMASNLQQINTISAQLPNASTQQPLVAAELKQKLAALQARQAWLANGGQGPEPPKVSTSWW